MTITPAVFTPERSENVSTLWSPTSSQTKGDCFTSTSLLGEGRRHIQALQEALLHLPHISASEERQLLPPNSVASAEPKSASTASSPSEGGGREGQSNATVKQGKHSAKETRTDTAATPEGEACCSVCTRTYF